MATPDARHGRSAAPAQPGALGTVTRTASDTSSEKRKMSVDVGSPIHHLYLTFDTALPTLPAARQADDALPPCPDMRRLGSPLRWGAARKNAMLAVSCLASFLTSYAAGSLSPPAAAVAEDLGSSQLVVLVGITTFCLGFALAPMALAPISEIWGRFPVFVAAGAVFVASQALCAAVGSVAGLLAARFLVGVGASVFSAVVGGVIADLWAKEERNTPMALFSGAVLAGAGAGPLLSTALVRGLGNGPLAWRWTFGFQAIADAAPVVALPLVCRESRASVLLRRKARLLNRWYEELERFGVYGLCVAEAGAEAEAKRKSEWRDGGPRRIRWLVRDDEERPAAHRAVALSIGRPFRLLLTEPIVFCFSLWAAFSWAVLYLSFAAAPLLYRAEDRPGRSSGVYAAMVAASALATAASIAQQRLLRHPQWRVHAGDGRFRYGGSRLWALMRRRFPAESPEARLYFACVNAVFLPAGLWGALVSPGGDADGSAPAVGLGFATYGIYSVYLANLNYLADAYGAYASSALAAQGFCRNVLGGVFPLIVGPLFDGLGRRGAGGLLGAIAMALTAVPWVLVFFGETIRARSKFAISLHQ